MKVIRRLIGRLSQSRRPAAPPRPTSSGWVPLRMKAHPDIIRVIDRIGEQMTLTRPEVIQKAIQLLALSCDRPIYIGSPDEPDKIQELLIK